MTPIFYDERELERRLHGARSIFLAGPTARGGLSRTPWRARALELLAGFDGLVVLPEFEATPFDVGVRTRYAHGECVALGMVAASRLANKLGMLDGESVGRITDLIAAAGLPTGGMKLDVKQVVGAMAFDKKVKSGRIRFVLPDRIGHVVVRDDVPPQLVWDAAASLQ